MLPWIWGPEFNSTRFARLLLTHYGFWPSHCVGCPWRWSTTRQTAMRRWFLARQLSQQPILKRQKKLYIVAGRGATQCHYPLLDRCARTVGMLIAKADLARHDIEAVVHIREKIRNIS